MDKGEVAERVPIFLSCRKLLTGKNLGSMQLKCLFTETERSEP
jgi:hypothetical protein